MFPFEFQFFFFNSLCKKWSLMILSWIVLLINFYFLIDWKKRFLFRKPLITNIDKYFTTKTLGTPVLYSCQFVHTHTVYHRRVRSPKHAHMVVVIIIIIIIARDARMRAAAFLSESKDEWSERRNVYIQPLPTKYICVTNKHGWSDGEYNRRGKWCLYDDRYVLQHVSSCLFGWHYWEPSDKY